MKTVQIFTFPAGPNKAKATAIVGVFPVPDLETPGDEASALREMVDKMLMRGEVTTNDKVHWVPSTFTVEDGSEDVAGELVELTVADALRMGGVK